MGSVSSKIMGDAYHIEPPIEAQRFDKGLQDIHAPRTLDTHEGFTSYYEKQGSQKGLYQARTPGKKQWQPSNWTPSDFDFGSFLGGDRESGNDPDATLSDDGKESEWGGGDLISLQDSLSGSLASSLQVQAERGGRGYGEADCIF